MERHMCGLRGCPKKKCELQCCNENDRCPENYPQEGRFLRMNLYPCNLCEVNVYKIRPENSLYSGCYYKTHKPYPLTHRSQRSNSRVGNPVIYESILNECCIGAMHHMTPAAAFVY